MPQETNGQDHNEQIVSAAVKHLAGHFDSVSVFVTYTLPDRPDSTFSITRHAGNFFARYGIVKEWIMREEESIKEDERKSNEE